MGHTAVRGMSWGKVVGVRCVPVSSTGRSWQEARLTLPRDRPTIASASTHSPSLMSLVTQRRRQPPLYSSDCKQPLCSSQPISLNMAEVSETSADVPKISIEALDQLDPATFNWDAFASTYKGMCRPCLPSSLTSRPRPYNALPRDP